MLLLGVILLDDLQVGIPASPSLVSLQRQRGVVLILHVALEVITKRLHLADGVECLLGFLVGILDVPRQLLGCELVVDDFQRVRDYIVLLGQRSEGSEDGIVDVLEQQDSVEGVDHLRGHLTPVFKGRRLLFTVLHLSVRRILLGFI